MVFETPRSAINFLTNFIFTSNTGWENPVKRDANDIDIHRWVYIYHVTCISTSTSSAKTMLYRSWAEATIFRDILVKHYRDVIRSAMTSQITGVTIVYSTFCSSPRKGPFVGNSQLTGEFPTQRASNAKKMLPFDELIMTWTLMPRFEVINNHRIDSAGKTGHCLSLRISIAHAILMLRNDRSRKYIARLKTIRMLSVHYTGMYEWLWCPTSVPYTSFLTFYIHRNI